LPARPAPASLFVLLLLAPGLLLLNGCGNFFVCAKASCTTSTTSSSTNDFAYVTNSATAATSLDGFAVSSGTLVAATGAPTSLGYIPTSLVVTIPDTYVYVASSTGYIYGYALGTGGALTPLNTSGLLVNESSAALEVSPDGKYLFSLNADGLTLEQYTINTSTGLLTAAGNYSIITSATAGPVVPYALKFAPSGDFLVCALGTGGAEVFGYSAGALTFGSDITPANTSTAIYGVTVDANNYIYTVGTVGLQVFTTSAAGAATYAAQDTASAGARSVVVTSGNNFVYAANPNSSLIYGDSIGSNGALTALSTSPYNGPTTVGAIGRDNSGSYIVTVGYSATSGIQIFTLNSTTGALTLNNSVASGTVTGDPAALGMTH